MKRDPDGMKAAYAFATLAVIFWLAHLAGAFWWLACGSLVFAGIAAWGGLIGWPEAPKKKDV